MENKLKEIHEFVKNIYDITCDKVKYAEENKLPKELLEYEKGRQYETGYILENIERIIYK
jgi:hypothetical protein